MAQTTIESTTQVYLDIHDISDDILMLKDGSTAIVMTVNAMNFGLLAEPEQDAIMYAYAGLLNSLNYPVQIVIRSQTKDVTSYLNLLKDEEEKTESELKKSWISRYRSFVGDLIKQRNVLDKKFYVVVSATALDMGFLPPSSVIPGKKQDVDLSTIERSVILEKAREILEPRRDHLLGQFARIGLAGRQLTTQEIIQLFYLSYNPEAAEGQQITDTQSYTTPLVQASVQGGLDMNTQRPVGPSNNQDPATQTHNSPRTGSPPVQSAPDPNVPPQQQPQNTPMTPGTPPQQGVSGQTTAQMGVTASTGNPTPPATPAKQNPGVLPSQQPTNPTQAPVGQGNPGAVNPAPSPNTTTTPSTKTPTITPPQPTTNAAGGVPANGASDAQSPTVSATKPTAPAATQSGTSTPAATTGTTPASATSSSTSPASASTNASKASTGGEKDAQDEINSTLKELGNMPAAPAATPSTPSTPVTPAAATPAASGSNVSVPPITPVGKNTATNGGAATPTQPGATTPAAQPAQQSGSQPTGSPDTDAKKGSDEDLPPLPEI